MRLQNLKKVPDVNVKYGNQSDKTAYKVYFQTNNHKRSWQKFGENGINIYCWWECSKVYSVKY